MQKQTESNHPEEVCPSLFVLNKKIRLFIFTDFQRKIQGPYQKMKRILPPRNCRLAFTSLKSVEIPPCPLRNPTSGGVMLFAQSSFLIHQIFSEKVQNVANTLKILCKIFGNNSHDSWFRKSGFLKIVSSFWQDFQDINFEEKQLIYTSKWSKKLF